MERNQSVTTLDKKSNGTFRSRLSNLTSKITSKFKGFESRSEECVSRSSRSSILTYDWELYKLKSEDEKEKCKIELRAAIQKGDQLAMRYYEKRLRFLIDDENVEEDSPRPRMPSIKTDTMRAHWRPKRADIRELNQK